MNFGPGDPQRYALVAGVVVVCLAGLVVAWRIAKSMFSLLFWLFVLAALIAGGIWLLKRADLLPTLG
jgi:hypothetical protein